MDKMDKVVVGLRRIIAFHVGDHPGCEFYLRPAVRPEGVKFDERRAVIDFTMTTDPASGLSVGDMVKITDKATGWYDNRKMPLAELEWLKDRATHIAAFVEFEASFLGAVLREHFCILVCSDLPFHDAPRHIQDRLIAGPGADGLNLDDWRVVGSHPDVQKKPEEILLFWPGCLYKFTNSVTFNDNPQPK